MTIGGRPYRLACNPGEEPHLRRLAKYVDGKIGEMRGAFRDIDDQRIVVMAALSLVDDLFEAKRKAEARGSETEGAQSREKQAAEQLVRESDGARGGGGPRRRARSRHRRDRRPRRGADRKP